MHQSPNPPPPINVMPIPQRRCSPLLFVFLLLSWIALSSPVLGAVETWNRWEHSLTSTKTYSNPYAEVTLKVDYSGPDQQVLQGLGYWNGGDLVEKRGIHKPLRECRLGKYTNVPLAPELRTRISDYA
jgi:hypothetical protein